MAYFITGGTGFIGKNFIDKLKEREGDIYVLTREGSMHKFEQLQERLEGHSGRLIPVKGDLIQPQLGVDEGTWREDMFEEAENLDHPYFFTKHDSEGIVRADERGALLKRAYHCGASTGPLAISKQGAGIKYQSTWRGGRPPTPRPDTHKNSRDGR